jgi:pimeloyl-ACP methyl ester carboxylesterase
MIIHRSVDVNGLNMHIAEAGSGPLVLLPHGFPECWYSWRHQLDAPAPRVSSSIFNRGRRDRVESGGHFGIFSPVPI